MSEKRLRCKIWTRGQNMNPNIYAIYRCKILRAEGNITNTSDKNKHPSREKMGLILTGKSIYACASDLPAQHLISSIRSCTRTDQSQLYIHSRVITFQMNDRNVEFSSKFMLQN